MTIVCPSASDRRFCTMRAMTSVPPPGGYGTMKRTGFAGQPCAHARAAAASARTRTIAFLIEHPLRFADGQQLEFRRQRVLDRAMLGLAPGQDAACCL